MGSIGGFTMFWFSLGISSLRIDDPLGKWPFGNTCYNSVLDAVAVHFGGGLCGLILGPVFMKGGVIHWRPCSSQARVFTNILVVAFYYEAFIYFSHDITS